MLWWFEEQGGLASSFHIHARAVICYMEMKKEGKWENVENEEKEEEKTKKGREKHRG